jgi:hypothetical protein
VMYPAEQLSHISWELGSRQVEKGRAACIACHPVLLSCCVDPWRSDQHQAIKLSIVI